MPDAPGWPGIPPRWTSSAKSGIGTALSPLSRVWFTLSHGILNEIYYPRVDQACTRDFGLIVTDGTPGGFFSEEKRDTVSELSRMEDGVPIFVLRNTCRTGRYRIEKWVASDPRHDVVLQRIHFVPLNGAGPGRLFALLAPHLVNGGAHNTAWIGSYKGDPMLFAEGDGTALALACSQPWLARSVGFVGVSDGWQDLSRNGTITADYDRAADGNVALTAEIDIAPGEPVVIALAFGRYYAEAAFRARASLARGFDLVAADYALNWRNWQRPLAQLDPPRPNRRGGHNFYRISTAVLRAHDSYSFPGGIIASLSVPWGASKGDDDLGGYHLVWPRDLVEAAGGLIACGANADARRVLDYLRTIQEADGHWPQNNWLDGLPYWRGIQMDECAFPILLAELAHRYGALSDAELPAYWPMVRAAAGFVLRNGPSTAQDRWEEDAGYSPFTLAVEVAALLAAAELAERVGEPHLAGFFRDTADAWNDDIETWTYVADTTLAREAGVRGYYVRLRARWRRNRRRPGARHGSGAQPPAAGKRNSRRGPDQPGCARARALRAARARRPAYSGHDRRDRPAAEGRSARRPRLAALQQRRLRRAPGRACVRRAGAGSGLAAADRRAGALRARGRRRDGGAPAARHHGGLCQRRRAAAGAGLGRGRRPRTGTVPRPAERLGHAAGLGARRVYQAGAQPGGGGRVRHAAAAGAAVSTRWRAGAAARLAPDLAADHLAGRAGATDRTRRGGDGALDRRRLAQQL